MMSKKDKEIPSKEEAKIKIAGQEIQEALAQEKGEEEGLAKELSKEEIEALQEKAALADQYYDQMLRIKAEVDNQKKRLMREKEDFIKFSNETLLAACLPILDNFDRALEHAEKDHDPKHIIEGVKMIQKMFEDLLQKQGVTPISPLGEKFNPHQHEAIAFNEIEEGEEDQVAEVLQKGFLLHGRLLRPATVKITKKKNEPVKNDESKS